MDKFKTLFSICLLSLLYATIFYGVYVFLKIFMTPELSIFIVLFLLSLLLSALIYNEDKSIHLNNLSDEEIEIITFILNNYPREMALKFKEQIVENSQEWFIKLLPITQFYKSLRDKIYEIQAKYVFENNEQE